MDHDLTRCDATLVLTLGEVARLNAVPRAAYTVGAEQRCEIRENRHPGPHIATGQAASGTEWWLVWDDTGQGRLKALPSCGAEDVELDEPCLLPLNHPGPHTCDV